MEETPSRIKYLVVGGLGAAAIAIMFIPKEGLSAHANVTFSIFLLAATLWISSILPPFAVGLFILGLLAATLSFPWGGSFGGVVEIPWDRFAAEFVSSPVVITFAGMLLAAGAASTGIDRLIAARLLGPIVHRPRLLMLAMLALGAGMSMFVSNTATAVLLLALVVPLARPLGTGSRAARAMVMAAALGAAVGGLATPIATTPNLVAFGLLRQNGYDITFVQWIARGLPVSVGVIGIGYFLLCRLAGDFSDWHTRPIQVEDVGVTWRSWAWSAVFIVTISLWISQPWSGVPIGLTSLLPLATLPIMGIIRKEDIRSLDWPTLLLMGSGLCLGHTIGTTGVAAWIVNSVVPAGATGWELVAIFSLLATGLSTFMSNTATANVLLPLCLVLPHREMVVPCAIAIAFGSSLALALPISTPAMLLASSTGFVRPSELLRTGLLIGGAGMALTVASVLLW